MRLEIRQKVAVLSRHLAGCSYVTIVRRNTRSDMQRKATKQSRAANEAERRWIQQVKSMRCSCCGRQGPCIADHIFGSSYKVRLDDTFERVMCGHWFVVPLCVDCDSVKTRGSRRSIEALMGRSQVEVWLEICKDAPGEVVAAARQIAGRA